MKKLGHNEFDHRICKVKCVRIESDAQYYKEVKGNRNIFALRGIQKHKDSKVGMKGYMYYRSTEFWGLYFFIPWDLKRPPYSWDLEAQLNQIETTVEEVKHERIVQG